jgi:hypothetical protein
MKMNFWCGRLKREISGPLNPWWKSTRRRCSTSSILVVVLAVYVFKATEPEIQLLRAPSESVSPIPKDFAYRDKGKGVASVPAAPTAPSTPQNLETKTATGGRLEKDQDPHQLSGSGALRDNKMEEPGPPVAPLKKMESSESKPAPAPRAAVKEKDRAQPGVAESREAKGKSTLDSSTVGQTAVYKSAPIGITLQVGMSGKPQKKHWTCSNRLASGMSKRRQQRR